MTYSGNRSVNYHFAGCCQATEWRKIVAHGASRGLWECTRISPGGAKDNRLVLEPDFLSPLTGLMPRGALYPRLASWATVCRRSAASSRPANAPLAGRLGRPEALTVPARQICSTTSSFSAAEKQGG